MTTLARQTTVLHPHSRLAFLDGLRALASMWVVLGHCHLLSLGWTRSGTLWGRPLDLLLYMHLGVVVFLVLSGFCLALPVLRNQNRMKLTYGQFMANRAWRILPPYFAALGLILLINAFVPVARWGNHGIGLTSTLPWDLIVVNVLLLQDIFPQLNSINGPFWSIATEWHLYFIFPFLVLLMRRFGALAMLLFCACLACGLTYWSMVHPQISSVLPMTVPQPPYFIFLFGLGILAAAIAFGEEFERTRARLRPFVWLIGGIALLVLLQLLWKYRIVDVNNIWGFFNHLHIIDPLTGVAMAAALVILARAKSGLGILSSRPLVFLGKISYSLYLIHVPVVAIVNQQLLELQIPSHSPLLAFFLLAIIGSTCSILMAWLFAHLLEKKYLAKARHLPLPLSLPEKKMPALAGTV